MEVEITNLYSNVAPAGSGLVGAHGQSFLVKAGKDAVLIDAGGSGEILLNNMTVLGVSPDSITHLVLSHGHYDHTGGIPAFLDARTGSAPLPVFAHPDVREVKQGKMLFIKKPLGFPHLDENQLAKLAFHYSKEPQNVIPAMRTTGEITNRPERDGSEPAAQHLENGTFVKDPVRDDMSVILDVKDGQVIITGCAHAGILNICAFAKAASKKPIKAIIGGTHMVRYSPAEVLATGETLEKKYDDPVLYVNHCTDHLPVKIMKQTPATRILKEKYGDQKVKECVVGTRITFVA